MAEFNEDIHIRGNPPPDVSGLPKRSTKRLRIDSWERSNRPNKRAGDAIALHWMNPEAKAFIGWWDSTDPENPECKAWLGAHDEANNPNAAPHRHFSIEVTDSTGQMQTRLGIPYDRDHTNISVNRADFTINSGKIRIPQKSVLEFAPDTTGSRGLRWVIKMTSEQDLEILRYDDPTSVPVSVARFDSETGHLEVGSLGPADLVLTDRSTGKPSRLVIDNGKVCVEDFHDSNMQFKVKCRSRSSKKCFRVIGRLLRNIFKSR